MNFECHITCPREHGERVQQLLGESTPRWKYSAIDGDPALGKKVFCYLTRHSNDYVELHEDMIATMQVLLAVDVPVLRVKIELIMLDERCGQ